MPGGLSFTVKPWPYDEPSKLIMIDSKLLVT